MKLFHFHSVILNNRKINSETEPSEDNEDEDVLPQGRNIHPYKLLVTLVTYKQGRGDKGRIQWVPNTTIINALDSAFYQAFNNVQPTNKKFFLAVDVSDSMSQPVLGSRWVVAK